MAGDLPEIYFRIRENGAVVFKVDTENRQRRIEMEEIATINVKNGTVKPHGSRTLTEAETTRIAEWLADRTALLARREVDDIRRTIDHLNLTTQWAQAKASGDDLDAVIDDLLLAMHDLRSVLIRRKAERLPKNPRAAE